MKIAVIVVRVLMGLGFMVFGLNILHSFLPQPPPPEGSLMAQFMAIMVPTHWMTLVGFFQLLGGILVLSGRFTVLGLLILAPVLVNILAFHIFLMDGGGITPGLVFSAMELFLLFAYRRQLAPIFAAPSA